MDANAIVGPQFCVPDSMDLVFTTKTPELKSGGVMVTDINGNVIFKAEGPSWCLRSKQVLLNADGHPVISMQKKLRSAHGRWQVFVGDSSDPRNLLFSVKKTSFLQFKTTLDVFLANNMGEGVCDFKIMGRYDKGTCTIYKGNSSTVVALITKERKAVNLPQDEHNFGVHINPNIDYCFIAALVVILHKLFHETAVGKAAHVVGEVVGDVVGEVVGDVVGDIVGGVVGDIVGGE